ncbi:MAG: hypothetical protein LUH43_02615 [Clostridia bacterium]|nr:hypothetical protein [Clostridia bacterium]
MKKIFILILALAICFSVVSCTESIGDDDVKSAGTSALESDTESDTEASGTTKDEAEEIWGETDCPGSIYPYVWQEMNAMVVEWGETNGETWSYPYREEDNGVIYTVCTVEYVGVEITILNLFYRTAGLTRSEHYSDDYFSSELEDLTYILIPESCLDSIEVGGQALVFVDYIYGSSTPMCCPLGSISVADDGTYTFDGAPIFNVADGIISVPEEMSEVYVLKYYLTDGNTFMEKNYPDVDIRFEDGMTVEEFGEFVEYLCVEEDGLFYP